MLLKFNGIHTHKANAFLTNNPWLCLKCLIELIDKKSIVKNNDERR